VWFRRRNLKAGAIIEHRDVWECRGRAQPAEFAPFIGPLRVGGSIRVERALGRG